MYSCLPPNNHPEAQNSMEDPPYNLRCHFVSAIQALAFIQMVVNARTYDSAKGPKEWGMKRGALKSTVETVL